MGSHVQVRSDIFRLCRPLLYLGSGSIVSPQHWALLSSFFCKSVDHLLGRSDLRLILSASISIIPVRQTWARSKSSLLMHWVECLFRQAWSIFLYFIVVSLVRPFRCWANFGPASSHLCTLHGRKRESWFWWPISRAKVTIVWEATLYASRSAEKSV